MASTVSGMVCVVHEMLVFGEESVSLGKVDHYNDILTFTIVFLIRIVPF